MAESARDRRSGFPGTWPIWRSIRSALCDVRARLRAATWAPAPAGPVGT